MTYEQEIIARFCWEHPEFATRTPSLSANLWGDILHHGKIIAESDLHRLPLDLLGYQTPTSWKLTEEA